MDFVGTVYFDVRVYDCHHLQDTHKTKINLVYQYSTYTPSCSQTFTRLPVELVSGTDSCEITSASVSECTILYFTDLAPFVLDALKHVLGAGELVGVPGEVALAVGVLDVQPDEVVGDVVLVEALVHSLYVLLVVVVPAALVIGQCRDGGERLSA